MAGVLRRFGQTALLGLAAAAVSLPAIAADEIVGRPYAWEMGLPAGVTTVAKLIGGFHVELVWIVTAITLFVLALLAWVSFRYREGRHPKASETTHNIVIEILWTAVPVIVLVIVALPSFKLMYFMDRAQKPEMTVKITGHQWYWSYELPDQKIDDYPSNLIPDAKIEGDHVRLLSVDYPLVVPVDTTIQLLVTGDDVIHSWFVSSLGVQRAGVPGHTNETWMKVDAEGTYFGQCTQICGDHHSYMPIEVRAVSKAKYAAWADAVQKSTADDPLREANEKILGLDYSWMDQPKISAADPVPARRIAAGR